MAAILQTFVVRLTLGLVACVSMGVSQAGGNDDGRDEFTALLQNKLVTERLDSAVMKALGQVVPREILQAILTRPDYVNFEVECLPVQMRMSDSSFEDSETEMFCTCVISEGLAYLAFLTTEGKIWERSWDTTLPSVLLLNPAIGFFDAGLPGREHATFYIKGAMPGMSEFVLIDWDGTEGRIVSDSGLAGLSLKAVDIDGDGVNELSVEVYVSRDQAHQERVWRFDQASGKYLYIPHLKSGRLEREREETERRYQLWRNRARPADSTIDTSKGTRPDR